jgi:hypothetical protein
MVRPFFILKKKFLLPGLAAIVSIASVACTTWMKAEEIAKAAAHECAQAGANAQDAAQCLTRYDVRPKRPFRTGREMDQVTFSREFRNVGPNAVSFIAVTSKKDEIVDVKIWSSSGFGPD